MAFLQKISLLTEDDEDEIIMGEKRTIYQNWYPLHLFTPKELKEIYFSDITIFYGGNGSGKSTLCNLIAEKLNATRKMDFDRGIFFDAYVQKMNVKLKRTGLKEIKIITSDDVFDYLLGIHSVNDEVNKRRELLCEEYVDLKHNHICEDFRDDPVMMKDKLYANKLTMSAYVREKLQVTNVSQHSNGETALLYWQDEIKENAIYILDEPENSLSSINQIKLKTFIEESARFFHCQFIIATHSPFLLSLAYASVIDLDAHPAREKKWTELENVRVYHDFFKEHEGEF